MSQEDRVPERLRQRRVESALPRPSDSYHNKMPDDYRGWKDRSYRDNFQLKQQKAPNSEKSNLKHFHFQGSPSLNASILDGQEEKRINQKRIYLNPKPSTSGGMKRNFLKQEKVVIPNRIANLKNTTFAFNSVGHSSNLNESGLGFEDSVQNDKFELTLSNSNNNKGEASLIFRQNGLDNSSLNQNDSTIQKLREEIKKLQVRKWQS